MRVWVAELVGTALLLTAVVGSGIMGERLAGGNVAIALLANSVATGCALYALILMLAGVSGAHFNPLVTLVARADRAVTTATAIGHVIAQVVGAIAGVLLAHAMFGLPLWLPSLKVRTGAGQWLSEGVATFGLILVVRLVAPKGVPHVAAAVALYITGAYWFTASTSFANPVVTIARSLTDSFAGIRPADAPGFIAAQCVGALAAYVVSTLWQRQRPRA